MYCKKKNPPEIDAGASCCTMLAQFVKGATGRAGSPSAEADRADDVVHRAQTVLAVVVGDAAARLVGPSVHLQVGRHRRGGRHRRRRRPQQ